jgi:glycosyltransferase involved in cell wall biosynthesis
MLSVSRIDPRKGLRVVPDLVARLSARAIDASIDVIGPSVGKTGSDERAAIERRSAELGIAERVRFAGPMALDDLLPRYREYDLFVLPTLPGEGIPRVLLEAMAAGLPVVTTRVAGIPSLIRDGENGLLVDAPSPDAVAAAVERIVASPELRRRLIAGGYATARMHTLDRQAASMMARLQTTLAAPLRAASVA